MNPAHASLTFLAALSLIVASVVGMAIVLGDEVNAAQSVDGYGIAVNSIYDS